MMTTSVRREGGGPPPPLSFAHFLPLLVLLVSSSVTDIHAAMAMAKATTVGGRTAAIRRVMAGDNPTTRQGDDENDGNAADEDFPTQSPTPNPTEVPLADCILVSLSEDGCADAGPDCEWWTDDGAAAAGAVAAVVEPADPGTTAPPTVAPPPSICRIACDALLSRSSAEIDCLSTSHCEWIASFSGGDKEDGDPHCRTRVICAEVYEKDVCKDASPTCEWDDDAKVCGVATMAPTSESPTTASPTTYEPTTSPPTTDAPTVTYAPTASPSASARPTAAPVASPTSNPSDSAAPSVRPTHGPSASASPSAYPTDTPHPSHHPTSSRLPTRADYVYVRLERNDARFATWDELPRDAQLVASNGLRYTRETWDAPGTNTIEHLRYDDLSDGQREAAGIIGFVDGIAWNCWQVSWRERDEGGREVSRESMTTQTKVLLRMYFRFVRRFVSSLLLFGSPSRRPYDSFIHLFLSSVALPRPPRITGSPSRGNSCSPSR